MGLREMAEAHEAGDLGAVGRRYVENGTVTEVGEQSRPVPEIKDADLSESDVPASMDVPVYVAWQRMMQDVQWLKKSRQADKYKYRGIDDVMNLVGPAERRHGVFVMPTGVDPVFEVINARGGAAMNYARIVCRFTIYGPRGDTMLAEVLGEGFDTGDKSGTKAQSVALRTLYLNALAIQTNEPARDTEYGVQHEIDGPRRPTAEEYAAMALASDVGIDRLSQIKQELVADKPTAVKEIELADGTTMRLIDLVNREGKRKMAGG